MASYDFSQVTAAYDKASYTVGETMKITLSGNVVRTDDPTTETVSVALTLTTDSGGSGSVTATVPVSYPGAQTNVAAKIVGPTFVSAGRTWTVSADGLSATAVA